MLRLFAFLWLLLVFLCQANRCSSFLTKQPTQIPQLNRKRNYPHVYSSDCLGSLGLKRQYGLVRCAEKCFDDTTPQKLIEQARALRKEIQAHDDSSDGRKLTAFPSSSSSSSSSRWSVDTGEDKVVMHRLYFDIGREEGTWMDPRWGPSGKRIEGSVDVAFSRQKSQRVYVAQRARLRGGFASMNVGPLHKDTQLSYQIERATRKGGRSQIPSATLRFSFPVDGTAERNSEYGDVFIPSGVLYFSLPTFGTGIDFPSKKDGAITVKQFGWHTGWWREESRIVGTFRLRPFNEAKDIDGF